MINKLGADYKSSNTTFRVWAPSAGSVEVCLFSDGEKGDCYDKILMEKKANDIWEATVEGDLNKVYYTYKVDNQGNVVETHDPYAKAAGVNGLRSMVIDLEATNPEGFDADKGPEVKSRTDLIVTEISVLDTTSDVSCHAKYPGKYLGLTEKGLVNDSGKATGLDHLKELGITHVQIMPSYDFGSIDEASDKPQYNWGYDPFNYNVPEGSFSTDPYHGEVRIKEFKQMVKAFHDEGIGVIMDVVYNHTYNIEDSCFQKTAPDCYFRKDGDRYSNASACGNEVASEQPMVRKYIIDSLCYWASEYHIDGFRFDLMGVLDIETMNQAYEAVKKIRPDIVMYGEGWTGDESTLPESVRAMKKNVGLMPGVGVFSDDIRDAIKGHVFDLDVPGFVDGGKGFEEDIKFCVKGSVSAKPGDVVNYVSCHDNLTLWDKLLTCCPEATEDELLAMNRLSAAIVFTSQGIPFFLQGEEYGRTKPYKGQLSENSYNLPIEVNSVKYDMLDKHADLVEYYKGIIAIRKKFKALRLEEKDRVDDCISFLEVKQENVVAFTVEAHSEKMLIVYNANKSANTLELPEGQWKVVACGDKAGTEVIKTIKNQTELEEMSCLIAYLD